MSPQRGLGETVPDSDGARHIVGPGGKLRPFTSPEMGSAGPVVGLRGGRYVIQKEERSVDGRYSWLIGTDTLAMPKAGQKKDGSVGRVAVFVASEMEHYLARVRAHTVLQCPELAPMVSNPSPNPNPNPN